MEKKFNGQEMTYEEFAKRLSQTTYTAETMEQYRKMPKGEQDNVKDVGGFVLGKLKGGRRKKDCVISRSAVTLDMDYGTEGIFDEIDMFFDMKMIAYSTHKHTPEKPRLRLIIFLAREVTPDEYGAVSRMLADDIGIELFDDSTYEPSRLMYWPSTSSDGEYVFREMDGRLVEPDEVLARYRDWHDVSSWPVSSRQSAVVRKGIKQQADPLSKEGLIGAFNRTYSITDAIDKFLPDVYRPSSAIHGRYDYILADSAAGVVIYDGLFAYSHHATDPCCGKLMNAFDVVRLHKFGEKDARAAEGTELGKLPSFKAMQDFAAQDEQVKATLARERQELAAAEFSETEEDWQRRLVIDRWGNIKDSLQNIALIIRNDENFKNIVYNEFKDTIDVIGELPWKQVKPGWNDSDLANAKVYFERVYGIWSPAKFKDALLAVVSSDRLYHPIKEYFSTLKWDGTERVDTLLIDYFGAADTPYTRAVIRKTLVAAVARIYEPGIKFDSILVLNGPQGMGKSTFFSLLGKQWFSDSLSISDMRDKTAAEKLLGNWILEISEMSGIRKTEVEVVKSFVTRQDDKFRQAYGVNVESHPRKCVIVGSTNSEGGFLRDVTGNRRFWPVHVPGTGKFHPWELDCVDQVWAEAIHLYKEGEELFLKGREAEEAYKMQQEAMESDDREGIVAEYLDRLLPDNWNMMDVYQRRAFLGGGEFETEGITGTVRRERVCCMEIWVECSGKERQNLRKTDSYEIEGIINKIGGWKKYDANSTGKTKVALYGVQKTFVRATSETV
ncbi:MAG: virulence-associated E family protein [Eubacteriales bacterium]|nr:virulence-associated E family protein [Eubacteriales bacterium]